jgi:hypothetical protein
MLLAPSEAIGLRVSVARKRAHQVLFALRGPDDMGRDRERTTPPPRARLIIFRELLICFPFH